MDFLPVLVLPFGGVKVGGSGCHGGDQPGGTCQIGGSMHREREREREERKDFRKS